VLKALDGMRSRFRRLSIVFADVAYSRNGLPALIMRRYGWLPQTVLRPARVKGFVALPKRWIVERTFAWSGRYRRTARTTSGTPRPAKR